MTDSYGDGWNGNILAIKQNNTVVGTFGSAFTSGYSSGPVFIVVQGSVEAQIVVSTLGSWTNEVGFTVKAPNGTIIHQKSNGTGFNSTSIFATFCPVGACPVNPNVTYSLYLSDSYGDGWEGNVIAFKQNGTVVSTFTLANGSYDGPVAITLRKLLTASVVVYTLGNYSTEIGFWLYSPDEASLIFNWNAGSKLNQNTLLGAFCP